jgi:transposase InsO family protein
MSIREGFVVKALEPGINFSALCREYGISRKTGYKWLARYTEDGVSGLEDRGRQPVKSLGVSGDIVADVVAIRQAHPSWGAKKIAAILRKKDSGNNPPSVRTIARILERAGLVRVTVKQLRRRNAPTAAPTITVCKPNDLWTVDFKGWWLVGDGRRCEPLTARDALSRFVLCTKILSSTKYEPVRQVFEDLFSRYGLPLAIQSDNGSPFATTRGALGLTRLSVWWLSLGIELIRSRPGKLADNAAHERMHRDIADELEAFAALNIDKQQDACDRWRHDFNHHRPHEALDMKMPAEVYRKSAICYEAIPAEVVYPDEFFLATVKRSGCIKFKGHEPFISTALSGFTVGLQFIKPQQFALWFSHRKLGGIDFSQERPAFIASENVTTKFYTIRSKSPAAKGIPEVKK